jgi:hypothetical protein
VTAQPTTARVQHAARGLVAGAQILATERTWAALMRQEAAGPDGLSAAARHHPVPADGTVSGAQEGVAAVGAGSIARSHSLLCAQGGLTSVPQVSLPGASVDHALSACPSSAGAAATPFWLRLPRPWKLCCRRIDADPAADGSIERTERYDHSRLRWKPKSGVRRVFRLRARQPRHLDFPCLALPSRSIDYFTKFTSHLPSTVMK